MQRPANTFSTGKELEDSNTLMWKMKSDPRGCECEESNVRKTCRKEAAPPFESELAMAGRSGSFLLFCEVHRFFQAADALAPDTTSLASQVSAKPSHSAKQRLRNTASHWQHVRRKCSVQAAKTWRCFWDFGSIRMIVTCLNSQRAEHSSNGKQQQRNTTATETAASAAYDDRAISVWVWRPSTCCTPWKSTLCSVKKKQTFV